MQRPFACRKMEITYKMAAAGDCLGTDACGIGLEITQYQRRAISTNPGQMAGSV